MPSRVRQQDGQPALPWAFCWVNEDWTAKMKGQGSQTTYRQKYNDSRGHAEYMVRAFRDSQYVFVNGRPMLAVYQLGHAPAAYLAELRAHVYHATGWDLFVVQVAQDHGGLQPFKHVHHADALVEFYPNLMWSDVTRANTTCNGTNAFVHSHTSTLQPHDVRDVPVWRGSFSGWDATPRYRGELEMGRCLLCGPVSGPITHSCTCLLFACREMVL